MPEEPPKLEFTLELKVKIGPIIELGSSSSGIRRTVPILGGDFQGPRVAGHVLAGGADWQFIESDGLTFVSARYALETDDAVRIEVQNEGLRRGPPDLMDRIAAGEVVPPDTYYFKTTPRFYPPDGKYEWLKHAIFIGSGERFRDLVVIKVWQLL